MTPMQSMKLVIVDHLLKIEDDLNKMGVPMSRLTIIARDPTNDEMFVMLTSEPTNEDLQKAFQLATGAPEIKLATTSVIDENAPTKPATK